MIIKSKYLVLLLFLLMYGGVLSAQSYTGYIDSIDQYQKIADSLASDFTANVASPVRTANAHYSCAGKKGGAYAEMYTDSTGRIIYRVTWQSNCDSLYEDKAWYFINNKIVLAMDGAMSQGKRNRKYYKNDMLVFENGLLINPNIANDEDLEKGHGILKDLAGHSGKVYN